jgi:hypothetical protein
MNTASAPSTAGDQIGREGQPPRRRILGDQRLQPRLEDRHLAALQPLDLGGILVDADHIMPEIGKARPRDQPDISRSDHRNAHRAAFL